MKARVVDTRSKRRLLWAIVVFALAGGLLVGAYYAPSRGHMRLAAKVLFESLRPPGDEFSRVRWDNDENREPIAAKLVEDRTLLDMNRAGVQDMLGQPGESGTLRDYFSQVSDGPHRTEWMQQLPVGWDAMDYDQWTVNLMASEIEFLWVLYDDSGNVTHSLVHAY